MQMSNSSRTFSKIDSGPNSGPDSGLEETSAAEVEKYAPGNLHFSQANTDHMIANCETLVTRYSSVVYVAMALGKEIHSDLPHEELQRLLPVQNGGTSALNIAMECRKLFAENTASPHWHTALPSSQIGSRPRGNSAVAAKGGLR